MSTSQNRCPRKVHDFYGKRYARTLPATLRSQVLRRQSLIVDSREVSRTEKNGSGLVVNGVRAVKQTNSAVMPGVGRRLVFRTGPSNIRTISPR